MKKALLFIILGCAQFSIAQSEIFNEDFQNGIPSTWTVVDNDGLTVDPSVSEFDEAWITYIDDELNGDTVAASTSYFDPIDRADRWLITPKISLQDFGNIIKWEAMSADPSYPDDYKVLISTTDSLLSSFTDTLIIVNNEVPYFLEREVNLSERGFDDVDVFIAFVNTTFDGYKLFIDDFAVRVQDPVGVEEEEINLTVFPNPANDIVNISTTENYTLTITDINGKKIDSQVENDRLDISNFNSGIYFLRISTDKGNKTIKLVKS